MDRFKLKVAVYTLLVKDSKILLGKRKNCGWNDGNYGLPSGHLESGERLVEGAIREAKEESGVEIDPNDVQLVHVMHRMNRYVDFFFVAKKWRGEPAITEPDKCDDMNWFPLDDLPKNIVPSVRAAIESFQKGVFFSENDSSIDNY